MGLDLGLEIKTWSANYGSSTIVYNFLVGITVLIVAIPEGLPLAVTISLAFSVLKMQKEKNLVRRLHACETMGGVDAICSDKTGTLTQNRMTMVRMWVDGKVINYEDNPDFTQKQFCAEFFSILKEAICCNSTAEIIRNEEFDKTRDGKMDPNEEIPEFIEKGSKTEIALLKYLKDMGHSDYDNVRKAIEHRYHRRFNFSSSRKRSSFVLQLESSN
jgi:magnesium-transporting ATPase (P-type)